MIIGILHQGSGLGNQLHRYVATRVKATDLGVDWAMMYDPDGSGKDTGFKGRSFMDIGQWDKGLKKTINKFDITQNTFNNAPSEPEGFTGNWVERCVRDEFGNDIRSYDPEFNFVEDNTIIEGEFQDERYWEHREKEVDEWLKVEPLEVPDDTCVLGFRGGEFAVYPDLFLTKEYWEEAMSIMVEKHGIKRFEVHTDDEKLAKEFFGDIQVIHGIGVNWRSMRSAKHAIIANSSFFILPRWLRNGITIAPRYWGRRNTKVWSLPQNFYRRFLYI